MSTGWYRRDLSIQTSGAENNTLRVCTLLLDRVLVKFLGIIGLILELDTVDANENVDVEVDGDIARVGTR